MNRVLVSCHVFANSQICVVVIHTAQSCISVSVYLFLSYCWQPSPDDASVFVAKRPCAVHRAESDTEFVYRTANTTTTPRTKTRIDFD